MAGVICPSCGEANGPGEVLCAVCGYELAEAVLASAARSPARSPAARPRPEAGPDGARSDEVRSDEVRSDEVRSEVTTACPWCDAEVPDPANLICVVCLKELTPEPPVTPPVTPLRLLFSGQTVGVAPAGTVLLGRDAQYSPWSVLFADRDNVSRRHASVGLAADGTAWVRDEFSTNGTFVNDNRVPPGATAQLADGDVLRIASDVIARVELDRAVTGR